MVLKSGSLTHLETSGPVQACNGISLSLPLPLPLPLSLNCWKTSLGTKGIKIQLFLRSDVIYSNRIYPLLEGIIVFISSLKMEVTDSYETFVTTHQMPTQHGIQTKIIHVKLAKIMVKFCIYFRYTVTRLKLEQRLTGIWSYTTAKNKNLEKWNCQLFKKVSAFYGTRNFNTTFTKTRYFKLS